MSVMADFEETAQHVIWRRIRHATAANHPGVPWPVKAPPDLTFDREQYSIVVGPRL
jgi:hypothetical protein